MPSPRPQRCLFALFFIHIFATRSAMRADLFYGDGLLFRVCILWKTSVEIFSSKFRYKWTWPSFWSFCFNKANFVSIYFFNFIIHDVKSLYTVKLHYITVVSLFFRSVQSLEQLISLFWPIYSFWLILRQASVEKRKIKLAFWLVKRNLPSSSL